MKIWKFIIVALAVSFIGTAQGQTPTEQVLQMRTFEQGLVWTGKQVPDDAESQDLLNILSHASEEGWTTNVENFFTSHPQSPWSASLHHDYAAYCRGVGRTSKALEQWQTAWDLVKDDDSPSAKKLAGSIVANWMDLLSSLGRLEQLKELIAIGNNLQFASSHDRDLFQGARNAYYLMKAHPAIAYRCGTFALKAVGEKLGIGQNLEALVGLRSPTNGFSMEQLVEIGKQHGLKVVAVHRSQGRDLIVPSVVHWRANHYAAILEKQGDRYLVSDPTFGSQRYLTADVINEEASGDFLILSKSLPTGWTEIATNEVASIHGMGLPNNINDLLDKGKGLPRLPCGMPVWWVSEPYVNLWMADEPISYLTSRGEPITLRLSYKQRNQWDSSTFNFGTVGLPGWNNSWFSYVAISTPTSSQNVSSGMPKNLAVCSSATVYLPDGGEVNFTPNLAQNYDNETRLQIQQQASFTFTFGFGASGDNGVRLIHADGSQDIYGLGLVDATYNPYGLTRAEFLRTRHIDPHGNSLWFYYTNINSVYVLSSMVDYDGKTNVLSYYNGGAYTELLSAVTNAYGLNIHIKYDASNNLTNIVDAIGMSSGITYDTNNNPTALITPYGTTRFTVTDNGLTYGGGAYGNAGGDAAGLIDRSALIIDPTGATNLYMYRYDSGDVLTTATFSNVPTNTPLGTLDDGTGSSDDGLNAVYFRNSYHWNPRQYAALSTGNMTSFTASDYLLARTRHWLQDTNDQYVTEYLSVERDPSPDGSTEGLKTFYDYQGKSYSYRAGTFPLPSIIAWCLPGGETHYEYKIYGSFGNVTQDITTYTKTAGGVGTRTNQFVFANNVYSNILGSATTPTNIINTGVVSTFTVPNLLKQVIGADGNPIWSCGGFDPVAITNFVYTTSPATAVIYRWSRVSPDFVTNGLNQVATATYGSLDKIVSYTSAAGLTTTNSYDTNGFLAQTVNLQIGRTNSFGYGNNGLPIAFTNELGLNVALTWDNLLRPTSTLFPDGTYTSNRFDRLDLGGVRDRLGNWTSYVHDGARHLTVVTNANNAVTLLSWCGCGALTGVLDPLNHLTTLNEDLQGNVTNIIFPDYSTLNYIYDLAQRPTKLSDGAGRFSNLGYNNQSLITTVSNANGTLQSATFDIRDRAIAVTDANHITITNTFDNLDQLLAHVWPDGIGEGYGYTAQGLAFYTNRDNQVTLYGRNAAGWLMAVTNANGEANQVTRDPAGDILTLLDGLNHQTQWQLNQYGWVTNKVDALGRSALQLAYNPNGWVTNRLTPEKGNTGYALDNVGNIIRTIYPQLTISNTYDALNELTNMVDAVGSHNFVWTPAQQLQSESDTWTTVSNNYSQGLRTLLTIAQSGTNWTQSYAYDAGWRMTNTASLAGGFIYQFQSALMKRPSTILLPNGAYITNSFDSLANLKTTALVNHWGHILDGYTYAVDPLGLRTNITRNFGLTTNFVSVGNDKIGQLTSWTATESTGQPRYNEQLGWKYDAADNLQQRTNNLLVQSFTVDSANELTNITRTGTFTLAGATAAPASSILVNGQNAQTYSDLTFVRTNLTLVNGSNTFSTVALNVYNVRITNLLTLNLPTANPLNYDRNGNLTNDGTKAYGWDAENQMTNVTLAGVWKKDLVFDGLNRLRIKKEFAWNGSSWTQTNELRFIWDGNAIVQIRNSNNVPVLTLTRGLDLSGSLQGAGGIGGILAMTESSGASSYFHNDAVGNVTALMDGYENIVARRTYGAFGNSIFLGGNKAGANPFWFSSQLEVVPELYLYKHRPYSTILPGWPNRDPIQERGGINLYRYVHNNPLRFVDPWGLAGAEEDRETVSEEDRDEEIMRGGKETPEEQMRDRAAAEAAARARGQDPNQSYIGPRPEDVKPTSCPTTGKPVYRVWGDGSGPWGRSWTPVDPRTVPNYRDAAGLPPENAGRFLSEGTLTDPSGVTVKPAARIGNNAGGLPEFDIPNSSSQVQVNNVVGLNPEF